MDALNVLIVISLVQFNVCMVIYIKSHFLEGMKELVKKLVEMLDDEDASDEHKE